MAHVESEFLEFRPAKVRPGIKTKWWTVWSKSGSLLGNIRFHSPWRKYVFHPDGDTMFDASCMRDIVSFLVVQTREWQTEVKARGYAHKLERVI